MKCSLSSSKASRMAATAPLLAATPPTKATNSPICFALGYGAAVVAHDRVAQTLEHFGRFVALLLRVDHVRLGEHRAASGDRGGFARLP